MTSTPDVERALLAEVANKADLVWVQLPGKPSRGMWHVWHNDAVLLVTGGLEQPDPGLVDGGTVLVILRSKDKATRVLTVSAVARELNTTSDDWSEAAKALHPKRLNPVDGEAQPDRWRSESVLWELRPSWSTEEGPGRMSADSHRAEPVPTPATTSMRRPFHVGKATKRRK